MTKNKPHEYLWFRGKNFNCLALPVEGDSATHVVMTYTTSGAHRHKNIPNKNIWITGRNVCLQYKIAKVKMCKT
jgi:hypothetical protein